MTKSRSVLCPEEETSHWSHRRKKSLCDRRSTCPTALPLVLHITKSHVAIPHIYSFLPHPTRDPKPSVPESPRLFLSSIVLLHLNTTVFPTSPLTLFLPLSLTASISFTCCIQRPSGAWGQSVLSTFSSSCWSQTKHREKMCPSVFVGGVHAHAWPLLRLPLVLLCAPLSPPSERAMSHIFSPRLLSCAPSSSSVVLLPTVWCYSGTMEEDGEEGTVLLSCFLHLFKLIHCPFSLPPFSPPPPPPPPSHPGVWWGWIVAGLVVELTVGPRGWVEVYIVASGLEALQVHVEVTLRRAPSHVNLVLVEGLVLVAAAVGRRGVLERRVGLWGQALTRDLRTQQQSQLRIKQDTKPSWSQVQFSTCYRSYIRSHRDNNTTKDRYYNRFELLWIIREKVTWNVE